MNSQWYPNFIWDELKEKNFNKLCNKLLDLIVSGSVIHCGRKGKDKGIDARIDSDAEITYLEIKHTIPGPSVCQFKWRNLKNNEDTATNNLKNSLIRNELRKRWVIERPGYYKSCVLLTNVSFTVGQREQIEKAYTDNGIIILILDRPQMESAVQAHPVLWHFLCKEAIAVPFDIYRQGRESSLVDYNRPYVDVRMNGVIPRMEIVNWLENDDCLLILTSKEGGMGKTHLVSDIFRNRSKDDEVVLWLDKDDDDWDTKLKSTIQIISKPRLVLVIDDGIQDIDAEKLLRMVKRFGIEKPHLKIKLILLTRELDFNRWNDANVRVDMGSLTRIFFCPINDSDAEKLFDLVFDYEKQKANKSERIHPKYKTQIIGQSAGVPLLLAVYAWATANHNEDIVRNSKGLTAILKLDLKQIYSELQRYPDPIRFLTWVVLTGPIPVPNDRSNKWSIWRQIYQEIEHLSNSIDLEGLRDSLEERGLLRKTDAYYRIEPPPLADKLISEEVIDNEGRFKTHIKIGIVRFMANFAKPIARNIIRIDRVFAKGEWLGPKLMQLSTADQVLNFYNKLEVAKTLLPHIPMDVIAFYKYIINNVPVLDREIISEIALAVDASKWLFWKESTENGVLTGLIDLTVKLIEKIKPEERFTYDNANPSNLLVSLFQPAPRESWLGPEIRSNQWPHWEFCLSKLSEHFLQNRINERTKQTIIKA